jgi:mannose-6-phosphate isomerase-like protein (cupin superfamily)
MIIRKSDSHKVIESSTCGSIHEILRKGDYPHLDIAVAHNIGPTKAHFHTGFDEIYFVLDGDLLLKTYDPATGKIEQLSLSANELCVISRGIHHVIVSSSSKNRLCAITIPCFNAADEHPSDRL